LAALNPFRTARIINTIIFVVFYVPFFVIAVFAHIYYFFPSSRPTIDKMQHDINVATERTLYKLRYDDPHEDYKHVFGQVPVYAENQDLVIIDEYCRALIPSQTSLAEESRFCEYPISDLGRRTYMLKDEYRNYVYTIKQARALYQGKPLPEDP
jgi:hypothetical protein